MQIIETVSEMRRISRELRKAGKRIAFVPTMGALHQGHLSLVELGKQHADTVVMSIFVNPMQFAPHEDLSRYPRPFERDVELAASAGVDALFHPSVEEMYPFGFQTSISVEPLSSKFEGEIRPAHFRGVATVVARLFGIVQPNAAVFGQKDAQQVAVIKRMVSDLAMSVEIIAAPIVREADGLAMSSRNIYLSPEERKQATVLYESLQLAVQLVKAGNKNGAEILSAVRSHVLTQPLAKPDYISLVSSETFEPLLEISSQSLLFLAVRFGRTRLLDNQFFVSGR